MENNTTDSSQDTLSQKINDIDITSVSDFINYAKELGNKEIKIPIVYVMGAVGVCAVIGCGIHIYEKFKQKPNKKNHQNNYKKN